MASQMNKVIIYGARGALGQACVSAFKKSNWWVLSIDLERSGPPHPDTDARIPIKDDMIDSWIAQESHIVTGTGKILGTDKIQAIICVAGGWAGGNASSESLVKNTDLMVKQSVWPSVIAARLANLYLAERGLLLLTGAKPAQQGTPGMIGYGLAKAAVHQVVKSLAADGSGMPANSTILAILPSTLDTPMNRKWMPKANFAEWTPLDFVTDMFIDWASGNNRPKSGSLVVLDAKTTTVVE